MRSGKSKYRINNKGASRNFCRIILAAADLEVSFDNIHWLIVNSETVDPTMTSKTSCQTSITLGKGKR